TLSGIGVGPGMRSCCWKIIARSWIVPSDHLAGARSHPLRNLRFRREPGHGRRTPLWSAHRVGCEWQQGDGPRTLQCFSQRALMLGARSGDAARQYLAALGKKPAQPAHFLVVDVVDAFDAEGADLAAGPPARSAFPSIGH